MRAQSISHPLLAIVSFAVLPAASLPRDEAPTVTTPAGTFVGNSSVPDLDQFLGIPYAEPPVGDLRFADPVAAGPISSGPFSATAYGYGCLQDPLFADYNGLSEDCLTLNVIRPRGCKQEKLPVMFWIHGGGNMNGQSLYYNGTALTQFASSIGHPIIYVAFNYRLGGFGFPTNPDFAEAGLSNLGLKDQYLALQWVHDNIESFGGDPEKVVIFGESAGAWDCWAQLHHAYTENESNKYFRGVITQSGAPGAPLFPQAAAPESGAEAYAELLEAAGCTNASDAATRISCLRAAPADSISTLLTTGLTLSFTLDNTWFSKPLTDALTDNEMAPLPLIHGANLHEGSVFLPDPLSPPNTTDLISHALLALSNWSPSPPLSLAESLVTTYLSTPPLDLGLAPNASDPTAPASYWPAVALYSDTHMSLGRRALLRRRAATGVPTWGYQFNHLPPASQLNLSYEYPGNSEAYARRVGVQHGAELAYVFGEATRLEGRSEGDVQVAMEVMGAWVRFAWWLDPNGVEGGEWWPEYKDEEEGVVMVFAENGGGEGSRAEVDTQRSAVYEKWNEVREELGLEGIY